LVDVMSVQFASGNGSVKINSSTLLNNS
jgi:hypothetical protein